MYTCMNPAWRVPPLSLGYGTGSLLFPRDGRTFISRLAEENNPSVPVADVYCDVDDCGEDEDSE